jgi:hypothetical protein
MLIVYKITVNLSIGETKNKIFLPSALTGNVLTVEKLYSDQINTNKMCITD